MSTTGVGFVVTSGGSPINSGNAAKGVVLALTRPQISALGATAANRIDALVDLSRQTYAKNGAAYLSLAASTPLTPDLTAIASVATSQAGDASFALIYDIQWVNLGTQDVTVGNAAANSFLMGLAPSNATITFPANSIGRLHFPAGLAVNATNKNLMFNPGGNAAQIAVAFGGG